MYRDAATLRTHMAIMHAEGVSLLLTNLHWTPLCDTVSCELKFLCYGCPAFLLATGDKLWPTFLCKMVRNLHIISWFTVKAQTIEYFNCGLSVRDRWVKLTEWFPLQGRSHSHVLAVPYFAPNTTCTSTRRMAIGKPPSRPSRPKMLLHWRGK